MGVAHCNRVRHKSGYRGARVSGRGRKAEALDAIDDALQLSPSNAGWQAYRTWLAEEELDRQQNARAALSEPDTAETETAAPDVATEQTTATDIRQRVDPSLHFAH